MQKPEKPGQDRIPGIFRKLFAKKKAQPYGHLRENTRWKAKPGGSITTLEKPALDPAARFRTLSTTATMRATTPQNIPTPEVLPTAVDNKGYIPHLRAAETTFQPASADYPDHLQPASRQQTREEAPARAQPEATPRTEGFKALPVFWTIASLFSLIVNIILIAALFFMGRQLFVLKTMLGDQLLGGMYENFIFMDQAHIKTSISVKEDIPISFNVPISQDTVVVLTQNTAVNGANVRINSGGIAINSAANIILPAGASLPVHLELSIPVTTTVPVRIEVPVDIPLDQTELHKPFIGLQQVVAPFYNLLQPQVKGPQDVKFCQPFSLFCSFYFQTK